jgi:hypothetical protein
MNGPCDAGIRKVAWGAVAAAAVALTPVQAASPSRDEIHDLWSQGKDFFRQANEAVAKDPEAARALYGKAAMRFERIVKDGDIHSGELFYNIGNAYFRMKDIGRAILNYRRAEQYIPNDPNLQQNLSFARARRLDKVEIAQTTRVLKTLFFWHYDLPTGVRSVAFALCAFAFWVLASTRLFRRGAGWNLGLAGAGLLAMLFLGSLLVEARSLRRVRPGVVVSPEVVARKGDSDAYEPSFKEPLHAGMEFELVEDRGGWYRVELPDKRQCWLPSASVEMVR